MKLSPITIIIAGLSLALTIFFYGLFMNWIPNRAEQAMNESVLQKIKDEAAKMPQAKKRQADAVRLVEEANAAWQRVVSTRTPSRGVQNGGIDLAVNAFQLSVDTHKFRNNVQRAVDSQLHQGGVKIVNAPYVPDIDVNVAANSILASYYNFGPLPFPVVIYDLGNVTVQGTYRQITDNMRAWARMPHYLAVADGLTIDGTSPNLTGSYNVTLVGFIRGNVIAPAVKEAAATTNAGGGFGGFGGGFGPPSGGRSGGPNIPGVSGGGPRSPSGASAGGG